MTPWQIACKIVDDFVVDEPATLRQAIEAALIAEGTTCASKAREYASHYDPGSDGFNTFILLAEWIENRATAQS